MGKLYIIATNHEDQVHGPGKLLSLYDDIHPDVVLSEMNEIDLKRFAHFCGDLMGKLRQLTPDHEGVTDFMNLFASSLGFEFYTNEQYEQEQGIPNYMVDMPGGQRKLHSMLEEGMEMLLTQAKSDGGLDIRTWIENFKKSQNLNPEQLREGWEMLLGIEGTSEGEKFLLSVGEATGRIGEPDRYMEKRIRELYAPDKVIAYPVGSLHALESSSRSTLYSRIKDLDPERIPLL